MADFPYISIEGTAESLERIINMQVATDTITAEDDDVLITASALLKTKGDQDLTNYYTKDEIDEKIGDIETALTEVVTEQENIIVAMDSFIGGDSV